MATQPTPTSATEATPMMDAILATMKGKTVLTGEIPPVTADQVRDAAEKLQSNPIPSESSPGVTAPSPSEAPPAVATAKRKPRNAKPVGSVPVTEAADQGQVPWENPPAVEESVTAEELVVLQGDIQNLTDFLVESVSKLTPVDHSEQLTRIESEFDKFNEELPAGLAVVRDEILEVKAMLASPQSGTGVITEAIMYFAGQLAAVGERLNSLSGGVSHLKTTVVTSNPTPPTLGSLLNTQLTAMQRRIIRFCIANLPVDSAPLIPIAEYCAYLKTMVPDLSSEEITTILIAFGAVDEKGMVGTAIKNYR